jgi:hypothetical protein
MPDDSSGSLATATTTDGLKFLLTEFRAAGVGSNFWEKQSDAEDIRLAKWDGQSDDGKKWDTNLGNGTPAFPWNGASDVRCYQADEVINESVAIKVGAFWKSDVRVEGVEPSDLGPASSSTRFMEWMRDSSMRQQLQMEVELAAQYEDWYGWCALHTSWDRLISYRWRTIDMQEMAQIADGLQNQPIPEGEDGDIQRNLAMFPIVIADPAHEDIAIATTKLLYRTYVNAQLPSGLDETEIPDLSSGKARKIVRELRKEGRAEIPIPYVCRNKPSITALKPWRDIIFPTDTTDIQSARCVFIRQFLTEADLRAAVLSEGWDEEFVEEAIKTKGRLSVWNFQNKSVVNPVSDWTFAQQKNNLIEIIYAYHRAVDDDGIAAVYCTSFSANITSGQDGGDAFLVGKSGMIDSPSIDEYPLDIHRRESLDRQVMASRGIPEILQTSQREEKVIRDSVMDLISISTIPPLNVYKGTMATRYRFAPAAENMVTPGREPRLLEVPEGGGAFAAQYLTTLRSGVDHYFGRVREDVPPQLSSMLTEPKVRRFLSVWGNALKRAFCLWQKMEPEMFQKVTGDESPGEQSEKLDFIFHFDVAQLNPDMMEKKLAAFSQLKLEDSPGVMNQAALIQMKARMIDPVMAKLLVMDQGPASQQLFDKVKADVVAMSDGNEATYTDAAKDPSAQSRMQYLSQIIGANQRYVARLSPETLQLVGIQPQGPMQMQQGQQQQQVDPLFDALVKKYAENARMGAMQQQNKVTGRIGVNQATPGTVTG